LKSVSGLWRRLRAWKIGLKVGRLHLDSPDPAYTSKLALIQQARAQAEAAPQQKRVLYADELTFYRRPAPGRTWHEQGSGGAKQPSAASAPGTNTKRRLVAALDTTDGRVLWMSRSSMGVKPLCAFLRHLRRSYGPEMELVLVWDNWPVHYHSQIKETAEQERIELLYTPTYAPWTNPVEKLWDQLKDDVLRLHRLSHQWKRLRQRVDHYLLNLQKPNPKLLRRVGLAPLPN
jgi:transposase